jgi:hypothetical protein
MSHFRKRTCVEEICGRLKTVGLLREERHRGVAWVGWMRTSAAALYNLVRMRTLVAAALTRLNGVFQQPTRAL